MAGLGNFFLAASDPDIENRCHEQWPSSYVRGYISKDDDDDNDDDVGDDGGGDYGDCDDDINDDDDKYEPWSSCNIRSNPSLFEFFFVVCSLEIFGYETIGLHSAAETYHSTTAPCI